MQSQEINENPTVQDFIKELKHIRPVPEHSLIGTNLWVEALQDRLLPLKVLIQGFFTEHWPFSIYLELRFFSGMRLLDFMSGGNKDWIPPLEVTEEIARIIGAPTTPCKIIFRRKEGKQNIKCVRINSGKPPVYHDETIRQSFINRLQAIPSISNMCIQGTNDWVDAIDEAMRPLGVKVNDLHFIKVDDVYRWIIGFGCRTTEKYDEIIHQNSPTYQDEPNDGHLFLRRSTAQHLDAATEIERIARCHFYHITISSPDHPIHGAIVTPENVLKYGISVLITSGTVDFDFSLALGLIEPIPEGLIPGADDWCEAVNNALKNLRLGLRDVKVQYDSLGNPQVRLSFYDIKGGLPRMMGYTRGSRGFGRHAFRTLPKLRFIEKGLSRITRTTCTYTTTVIWGSKLGHKSVRLSV